MRVLKIKIYQPHAHYRMPFTYQRRHTYPLPPYSTVIGLLCNVLGIRNIKGEGEPEEQNYQKLKNLKISICGTFESKTTEYTWFRNLSVTSHNQRFGFEINRSIGGHIEHIGGQQPVLIDILNDVRLWIYLACASNDFLNKIGESFKEPSNRIYPLHLGRAEDWIVIEEIKLMENIREEQVYGNFKKFFWIPKVRSNSKTLGLLYKIPTFYKLENGVRNFEFVDTYLSEGEFDGTMRTYWDEEEKLPIFYNP